MARESDEINQDERSPLIQPAETDLNHDVGEYPLSDSLDLEDSMVESKSTWYLILLTLCIGGLQIVWSVELSNGSPYLLSLGMSKALLAFVWVAGPVTGVLVQPYVGMQSDRCRISWGKRKPFMVAGAIATALSSLLLAYAKDIIRVFGRIPGDTAYEGSYMTATIVFATIMMWVLDFSINTVQAAIRAFIVDNAPAHQQESANAWASRTVGIGNVFGYIFGFLNLPRYFSFLGNTQFKVLCSFASIALCLTVLISVVCIKERNPQLDPPSKNTGPPGLIEFFKQVFVSIRRLPPQVRRVCEIQFCHWFGWFPFLFYITTYIGQIYVNPYLKPGMSEGEVDELWGKATRIGTFALLIYAITSFSANIIFPFFIVPTYKARAMKTSSDNARSVTPTSLAGSLVRGTSWTDLSDSRVSASKPTRSLQTYIQIPGLTLRRAWLIAQLLFSVCMFSTFLISSTVAATIMTAFVGISWALTLWAPFALISAEIANRDELRRQRQRRKLQTGEAPVDADFVHEDDEEDQAGIILGLHNVAVSAPQVLATLASSIIFKMLQKDRSTPGDTSVAWTLRMGGIAVLAAAYLTWTMKENPVDDEE